MLDCKQDENNLIPKCKPYFIADVLLNAVRNAKVLSFCTLTVESLNTRYDWMAF